MTSEAMRQRFVEALAKHLPPSASRLRLWDIDGHCGAILRRRREDLDISSVPALDLHSLRASPAMADAIVAYDCELDCQRLSAIAAGIRPGGRFIVVNPQGEVNKRWVRQLEAAGLVRILVEPAVAGVGVLIRGEIPHTSADTMQRIHSVARADTDHSNLADYRGRYLHLLIRQSPNKPAWKREPGEAIVWRALALQEDPQPVLVAFSSLPKAVGFLQPAVLIDMVRDVNKVGKFAREVAVGWGASVKLNPTLDSIQHQQLVWLELDPETAAAPDE